MPWQEVSVMEQRLEFVRLATQDGANRRELCRRFGVSPQTGYRWLNRAAAGAGDLTDRSRRPHASPRGSSTAAETAVLHIRDAHPAWGARKIARCLTRDGVDAPAVSTVHAILQRHDRIVPAQGGARAGERFERAQPNELWQMDFKGRVKLADGTLCHPLTVIDDHSRYALCLAAGTRQTFDVVRAALEATFRRYGLPDALFVDNGPPWGDPQAHWTRLRVWLLKLGVKVLHSRPYHPQSRGKIERFHRSLNDEVFALHRLGDLDQAQAAFDAWRSIYNHERPHDALGLDVPANRYRISRRRMPATVPQAVYRKGTIVRCVPSTKGYISFKGRLWRVPEAFCGERLAIRPIDRSSRFGVFFAAHQVATIDLTRIKTVTHVPEQVSPMSPV